VQKNTAECDSETSKMSSGKKSRSRRECLMPTDNIMVLDVYLNLTKKSNFIGGL